MKAITLLTILFSLNANAQEPLASPTPTQTLTFNQNSDEHLRARNWVVDTESFLSFLINEDYKGINDPGGTGQSAYVEFGYNFGWAEVGPLFSFNTYKNEDDDRNNRAFGAYGRVNLVKNTAGNKFIPFARFDIISAHNKFVSTTAPDVDSKVTTVDVRGGVTWFPFDELVGIEVFLLRGSSVYDRATNVDYDYNRWLITTDFKIYF